MKTRNFKDLALGLASVALLTGPAGASPNCPAFNAGMVDATMMVLDLSQMEPIVPFDLVDSPSEPFILCQFVDAANPPSFFRVFVGVPVGEVEGEAEVRGDRRDGTDNQLRTIAFDLSTAQLHACRAQVLQSFVWNRYCAP